MRPLWSASCTKERGNHQSLVPGAIPIAVFLLLFAGCEDPSSDTSSASSGTTVEQSAEGRTFADWTFKRVPLDDPPSIGDVEQIRLFHDRLFVYDLASMTVKRYSLDGGLEVTYGKPGHSRAPGNFVNIFSFWGHEEKGVWVLDSNTQRISHFAPDGTFQNSFKLSPRGSRIAVPDGDRIMLQTVGQAELFALMNEEGEVLRRFGRVTEESRRPSPMALDGHWFSRPGGGAIWAPKNASYLFFYADDGTLERRIQLIDGHPFPTGTDRTGPTRSPDDLKPPQWTTNVSVVDESIFVTTATENVRGEGRPGYVLDRYDRPSGQYEESVELPAGQKHLVHDDMVYGATEADTTLQAFRIVR
jgi:hypothetical protein